MPFVSRSVVSPSDELYFAISSGGNTDSSPDFGDSEADIAHQRRVLRHHRDLQPGVCAHSLTASAAVRDFPTHGR